MRSLLTVVTVIGFLAACGPTAKEIAFEGDPSVTVHALGTVALPAASVLDTTGAVMADAKVTWSAEPAEIATVDAATGQITTLADGEAKVTAKVGELSKSFVVTVSLPDTLQIASGEAFELAAGGTTTLVASVLADGSAVEGAAVAWAVNDPAIATVDASGTVTAVAVGTATVTATSGTLAAVTQLTVTEPVVAEVPAAE